MYYTNLTNSYNTHKIYIASMNNLLFCIYAINIYNHEACEARFLPFIFLARSSI